MKILTKVWKVEWSNGQCNDSVYQNVQYVIKIEHKEPGIVIVYLDKKMEYNGFDHISQAKSKFNLIKPMEFGIDYKKISNIILNHLKE